MAKKRGKKTAKRAAGTKKPGRKKPSVPRAAAVFTIIRFRCVGGKCTVRPKKSPNIGRGAVFLVAENTSVTIDFLDKGSPFVNKTDPITIAEGGFALHFVDPDAAGGFPFKPKACDNCDEIQGLVPPEMIVP
jgi:hypothetical protein